MICPSCEKVDLRVIRCISAGSAGRTTDAFCPSCKRKFTMVTYVVEQSGVNGKRRFGRGAYGMAKKLASAQAAGRKVVDL